MITGRYFYQVRLNIQMARKEINLDQIKVAEEY